MINREYKRVNISELKNYGRNNKKHGENVNEIVKSIQANTYIAPIIVDENNVIIAGHGRKLALDKLGIKEEQVLQVTGLTDKQKRDYRLRDNKLSELSERDLENIEFELKEIGDEELNALFPEIDLNLLDYDEEKEDEVPDVKGEIIVKRGDIFQLGDHRIMCGDSTDSGLVKQLIGKTVDCIRTDPPYNVNYQDSDGNKIANDNMKDEEFMNFLQKVFDNYFESIKEGGAIYVAHSDTEGLNFRTAFKLAGFKLSGCLIWNKPSLVLGRSDYQWKHEPILYGWKEGSKHNWFGGRKNVTIEDGSDIYKTNEGIAVNMNGETIHIKGDIKQIDGIETSVINYDKPKSNDLHPTMKPIGLIQKMLNNSTQQGMSVLDLFLGSGSTLIACEKTNRQGYGMEISEHYIQVIIKRYHEYTKGQKEIRCINRILDISPITNDTKKTT